MIMVEQTDDRAETLRLTAIIILNNLLMFWHICPAQNVRLFFLTNRETCSEGLGRIRPAATVAALNAGLPHAAARHAQAMLLALVSAAVPHAAARHAQAMLLALVSSAMPHAAARHAQAMLLALVMLLALGCAVMPHAMLKPCSSPW